jgi:hypothetical protein
LPAPAGYTPRGGGGGRRGGGDAPAPDAARAGAPGRGVAGAGSGGDAGAAAPQRGAAGGGAGGGGGRGGAQAVGGVSIVKPKEYGGLTAYNMNTGDKAWWIPNGGYDQPPTPTDPMFAGVTLPKVGAGGQAQVITTKTLVVYGTGRNGGPRGAPPQIFAVDKATGKQVGAIQIPGKTTAVPMTYLYQGKQYLVFAVGTGGSNLEPTLVALALPSPGGRGGGAGR